MKNLKFVSLADFKSFAQEKKTDAPIDMGVLKAGPMVDIKSVDTKLRTVDFIISDESVDRDNDTIAVSGWDIANYSANPVVLFAHDHWQPPVARSLSLTMQGTQLRSKAQFTPKDMYAFGDMIFQFYEKGFMRATSVGFKPKEWKFNDDRKFGVDFLGQELLEYSCVPVPSNPHALMDAKSKGIDLNPLRAWAENYLDDERLMKDAGHAKDVLEKIRAMTVEGKSMMVYLGDVKSATEEQEVKETTSNLLQMFRCKSFESFAKSVDHLHDSAEAAQACDLQRDVLRTIIPALCKFAKINAETDIEGYEALKVKAGRVLSATNERKLRSAMAKSDELVTLIREVLDQLDTEEEESEDEKSKKAAKADEDPGFFEFDEDPNELDITEAQISEAIAASVGDELRSQINAITGRVD